MKKSLVVAFLLLFAVSLTSPGYADFFDKVNGFFDKVNGRLDVLNQRIEPLGQTGRAVTYTTVTRSTRDYYGGYETSPSGYPENKFSEKALEAMAALRDPWSRLKLDEIRNKNYMDYQYRVYKSISWFNIFTKIQAYTDYRKAKSVYVDSRRRTQEYKKNNPGAGDLVEGIDEINESVLEFKALFGNKKAKAQLELIRAKREYERLSYEYERANFFEKMKMRDELKYAERRYQLAKDNWYAVKGGKKPVVSTEIEPYVPRKSGGRVSYNGINNRVDVERRPIEKRPIYMPPNKNNSVGYGQCENRGVISYAKAKARMDRAYKRYMRELSKRNPNCDKLERYKLEYDRAVSEYNRTCK